MGITSVAIQFTIIDLLSKGVSSVKDRLKTLSSASKEVKKDFDNMVSSFKKAAVAGIATREMYKGLKPAIGLAGDLQEELLGVRAELTGAGKDSRQLADELKAIKSTAFTVQAWTPFDMTQIVALEKELIKAGAKVEDVTGKSGAAAAAAALAVYEKLDPVATGQALIGIGTPFKITADRYMELADTISRAASASTVGASEIAESAKYAAGPMSTLGKSSREMLALTAVMAQAGISGSMAGVALKEFFLEAAKHRVFRDAKGSLLPTVQIVDTLKSKLKGMGEAQRSQILGKLFGERGMQAAIALLNEGKGSYSDISKAMEESITLQDKLEISMSGLKNQFMSLKGTFRSTIADLYQPALPILTGLVSRMNEFVTGIGSLSQRSELAGKAVSKISLGAFGVGGLATVGLGAAGLFYARKVLTGVGGVKGLLKNFGSSAAGIAQGKAVEAATGVKPVFVTNWPLKFLAGESSPIDALKNGPLTTGGVTETAGMLKNGAPSFMGKAGLIGAAGVAGYTVGTGLNYMLDKVIEKMTGEDKGLGGVIYDLLHGGGIKNDININIDKEGRVMQEGNMKAEVKVNRGSFAPAH